MKFSVQLPTPVQHPHPPIWIGGNSRRAIRRAAEHGQGWSPFPMPGNCATRARTAALESIDDLQEGIAYLHERAKLAGRGETLDVNFVPFGARMNSDQKLDASALREQDITKPTTRAIQAQCPPVEHPVARTHPVTARKALFVNGNSTTRIVGLSERRVMHRVTLTGDNPY